MNLDELRSVQSKERRKDSLQQLRDSFYDDVAAYIRELRASRDRRAAQVSDPFADEEIRRLSDELETAEEVAEALYERRVGKVVKLASFAAADMSVGTEGMTSEERELFEDLVARIKANKHTVLDILAGGDGSADADGQPASAGASPASSSTATSTSASPPAESAAASPSTADATASDATPDGAVDAESADAAVDADAADNVLAAAMGSPDDQSSAGEESDDEPVATTDGGNTATKATGDTEHVPPWASDAPSPSASPSVDSDIDTDIDTDTDADVDTGSDIHTDVDTDTHTDTDTDTSVDTAESEAIGADVRGEATGTDAHGDDTDRTTLRITEDVGEIFGVDEREYTLRREDVVTLPSANAEPLVERDAAMRLE